MKAKHLGLAFGLLAAAGLIVESAQAEPLKIGIIESLSGSQISAGAWLFASWSTQFAHILPGSSRFPDEEGREHDDRLLLHRARCTLVLTWSEGSARLIGTLAPRSEHGLRAPRPCAAKSTVRLREMIQQLRRVS